MEGDRLLYEIALTLVPGIGDILGKKLVNLFGSAEAVFREPSRHLKKLPRIGETIVHAVSSGEILQKAEKELLFMERFRIKALFFLHDDYPGRLKNCHDGPLLMFYKGNANLNAGKIIGIVGTRSATEYGKRVVTEIISGLTHHNPIVISGLAYGIDSMAHRISLDCSLETIGVLGHGLDTVYPWQNRNLAERMLEQGGLVTEFISGTKPDRMNFPMRNRIIAGLCDAIVVIEAGKKGGALITAELANSYNRDVFAVPGKVHDPYSEGTNYLIRTNRASLVQKPEDIEYLMGWKHNRPGEKIVQKQLFYHLTDEETIIYQLISDMKKAGIDEICINAGMPMSKVSSCLLNMEFEGIVTCLPGKIYSLI